MKLLKKLLLGFVIFCVAMVIIGMLIPENEGEDTPTTSVTVQSEIEQEAEKNNDISQTQKATEQNDYMKLAQNKEEYLLFLRIIGNAYKNNSLTNEMFDEMAEYNAVQLLVEDVIMYRYKNGNLSPDFCESFSFFWTDEMTENETETLEALKTSFSVSYDFVKKVWVIEENEESAIFNNVYKIGGEEYRDFEGRLKVGDIIYLKDEEKMIPYFEVLDFGENMEIYPDEISENTVYVKELYSIMGEDLTSYWRDFDDMLEHNRETREESGYPVYYLKK